MPSAFRKMFSWLMQIGTANGLRNRAFQGSTPCENTKWPGGEIGKRTGLKIQRAVMLLRDRSPLRSQFL